MNIKKNQQSITLAHNVHIPINTEVHDK